MIKRPVHMKMIKKKISMGMYNKDVSKLWDDFQLVRSLLSSPSFLPCATPPASSSNPY